LDLASEKWWIDIYIYLYVYDISEILFLKGLWSILWSTLDGKKRDLQASRSQCETAKSCVLLKFSEYCQILGYINKVVSIYI
jgi:hypothetical protein